MKIVDPKTGEEKEIVVLADDGIRSNTTLAVLSKLKPAFSKDGTTTAGKYENLTECRCLLFISLLKIGVVFTLRKR